MIAKQTVAVDAGRARQNLRLVEHLEDLEDVQRVTSNLELTGRDPGRGRRVIVLGIDPGTASLGYGLVDRTGSRLRAIDFGVFHTGADLPLPERLLAIHTFLQDLIELHGPTYLGVERIFHSRNVQTALAVGHARGVVLLAAAAHELEVREATPSEVKIAVTGYGAADKGQVGADGPGDPRACPSRRTPTTRPTRWRSRSGRPTASAPGERINAGPPRPGGGRRRGVPGETPTSGPSARPSRARSGCSRSGTARPSAPARPAAPGPAARRPAGAPRTDRAG